MPLQVLFDLESSVKAHHKLLKQHGLAQDMKEGGQALGRKIHLFDIEKHMIKNLDQ
jgi:hypothetical protein